MIEAIIRKGAYFDSVKLMLVTQQVKSMPGIIEVGVVMGTDLNKDILARVNLLSDAAQACSPADLIIAVNAEDRNAFDAVIAKIDGFLNASTASGNHIAYKPKTLVGAMSAQPTSNLVIISTPGNFAKVEARKALNAGLHVMLFSDNMSLADEKELKELAQSKNLFVMGPDCGTSIINGTALCFANQVRRGNIGIVGASGTGMQEISTLIHKQGAGLSHAIGTGGRDLVSEIGGMTMLQGIRALNEDDSTEIMVLVSKPPADEVADKIFSYLEKNVTKPVVINFLGGKPGKSHPGRLEHVATLEEAALKAVQLARKTALAPLMTADEIGSLATRLKSKIGSNGKYLRGLFCGGTLNYEAIIVLEESLGGVYSNSPLDKKLQLQDPYKLTGNACIDLGDDVFTQGRAHPMIDPTLRSQMLTEQINQDDVAVILFDVVLGYGAHDAPANDVVDILKRHADKLATKVLIASICGTDEDPQHYEQTKAALENSGVIIAPSNRCAALIAGKLLA
ncbi:acyl-CoA synthetase FdrA [Serratia oryzae]|uniref:FdrA family protein n=1 Tax=Serratia oryzae TaxID=2034155 RepID=A0A1S8CLD5_9GAMM|nr:acyl-CoA synthetase FdrA [Serratia oryzae]OMQ23811.1 hypothetical protein BMI79_09940 [Serratia oryzae]VXD08649.1 putative enzyme with acyl-CoA domain [Enterobacterales bacterium 8AC]